jgi:hypothetical protein
MSKINKKYLSFLYHASDIANIWQDEQSSQIIDHPIFRKISPNYYRAKHDKRPCPFCGKKMVHGYSLYTTNIKKEAISRGYQYQDKDGKNIIRAPRKIESLTIENMAHYPNDSKPPLR